MTAKRIVILRHGEKPGDAAAPDVPAQPHLSPLGVARAKMLATLIPEKFGMPDWLIAAMSSNNSDRPVETLQPLADKLVAQNSGFTADKFIKPYANEDFQALATDLLNKLEYAGKLIIVCWHHGNIPGLGLALGASEAQLKAAPEISEHNKSDGKTELKWDPQVFNKFWILDFTAGRPGVAFQSVPQSP